MTVHVSPGRGILATPWVPATILLLGSLSSLAGLAWDIQWHDEVGPDTFFTLPHLFIYAGTASSGLVSLAVVLASTAATRAGRTLDTRIGGRPVAVFGVFRAPIGYLVSGVGAAIFMLYGLWDEWWHGLYGFDAVIASPPHIGLLTSVQIAMIGSVITCAAAWGQRWAGPALVANLTIMLAYSMVVVVAVPRIPLFDLRTAVIALLSMITLATAAAFTRGLRAVLFTALGMLSVQVGLALFAPWATQLYAVGEGLPLRDYAQGVPQFSTLPPATLMLGVAALALASAATRRNAAPVLTFAIGGALGGAALAATVPWQPLLFGSSLVGVSGGVQIAATIVAGAVLGAGGGLLGDRLGRALRLLVVPAAVRSTADEVV